MCTRVKDLKRTKTRVLFAPLDLLKPESPVRQYRAVMLKRYSIHAISSRRTAENRTRLPCKNQRDLYRSVHTY